MRRAFHRSRATGLIANYARGFIGQDLEFVRDLSLQRLTVLARTIADISPVYSLSTTLTELRLEASDRIRIDLHGLPNLRTLSTGWAQVADCIGDTNAIEDLRLGAYGHDALGPLSHLTSLRSLQLVDRPRVRSLDGAESMPWLAELAVHSAPLSDTTALAHMRSPFLTNLRLPSCRAITSLSDLSGLTGLRFFELSEAGSIDSLRPIAQLALLERLYLYGSTRISDGDLTPLVGMTRLIDLRIMNRRSYVPSVSQVMSQLGTQP